MGKTSHNVFFQNYFKEKNTKIIQIVTCLVKIQLRISQIWIWRAQLCVGGEHGRGGLWVRIGATAVSSLARRLQPSVSRERSFGQRDTRRTSNERAVNTCRMVLADRGSEKMRNGGRSRGTSPNGHASESSSEEERGEWSE